MDIEFMWPGDADHDDLDELFRKYDTLERELILKELSENPTMAVLEGED